VLAYGVQLRDESDVVYTTSTVFILLPVPFIKVTVVAPEAPAQVSRKLDPAIILNEGLVKCRPVEDGFVPAPNIVNVWEKAVCPDVSSSRRTYWPAGVVA
jgi:hypothetical protein